MSEQEKLCQFIRHLFLIIGITMLMYVFITDNTDTSFFKRSGIVPHIDNLTGCEYLSKGSFLIPRVDANGTHICNEQR